MELSEALVIILMIGGFVLWVKRERHRQDSGYYDEWRG